MNWMNIYPFTIHVNLSFSMVSGVFRVVIALVSFCSAIHWILSLFSLSSWDAVMMLLLVATNNMAFSLQHHQKVCYLMKTRKGTEQFMILKHNNITSFVSLWQPLSPRIITFINKKCIKFYSAGYLKGVFLFFSQWK